MKPNHLPLPIDQALELAPSPDAAGIPLIDTLSEGIPDEARLALAALYERTGLARGQAAAAETRRNALRNSAMNESDGHAIKDMQKERQRQAHGKAARLARDSKR